MVAPNVPVPPRDTSMKLCADCIYYVGGFHPECGHPSVLSPVDGKPHQSCSLTRSTMWECGPRAKLFKPKKAPKPEPYDGPKCTLPRCHLWPTCGCKEQAA